jgi:hypothetical protein
VIFQVKLDIPYWPGHVNSVRAWLLIEVIFFFSWICASILFLFLAYLFKFSSVVKRENILKMDLNVWNDRDTDDFLRYLKFEYFMVAFMLTFAVMEYICFFDQSKYTMMFGPNRY